MRTALFLAFYVCATSILADYPEPITPQVVAHRGFSYVAPENTISAVKEAIKCGAHGCEMDVYMTRDGVVVLLHDEMLKRTVRTSSGEDAAGKVTEKTLDELKKLDFGISKSVKFKGEPVPLFTDVLNVLQKEECVPVVEIKQNGIEDAVIRELRARKMEKNSIIISFNQQTVKNCREKAPEICTAWLCRREKDESEPLYLKRILRVCEKCKTNMVDLDEKNLTPFLFNRLTESGITVMVWTVDDPVRMKVLYELGVKSITTNRPDLGLAELE